MTSAPSPIARESGRPRRQSVVLLAALGTLLATGIVLLAHGNGGTHDAATLRGSGVAASETRSLPPFDALDLAGSNRIVVTIGAVRSVVVHADENLLGRVTTDVREGTLVVDNRGSFTTTSPMSVEVVVPSLRSMTLSGSGALHVTGVDADSVSVNLAGSGLISVTGQVDRLAARLGGSGDCRLETLSARDATAALTGSGRILVRATHTLDAAVDGTRVIAYTGMP